MRTIAIKTDKRQNLHDALLKLPKAQALEVLATEMKRRGIPVPTASAMRSGQQPHQASSPGCCSPKSPPYKAPKNPMEPLPPRRLLGTKPTPE